MLLFRVYPLQLILASCLLYCQVVHTVKSIYPIAEVALIIKLAKQSFRLVDTISHGNASLGLIFDIKDMMWHRKSL